MRKKNKSSMAVKKEKLVLKLVLKVVLKVEKWMLKVKPVVKEN